MDFIKIYDKHLFGWSLRDIGAIVKLQLLTARLERIPTEKEMIGAVTVKAYESVGARLQPPHRTLTEVLQRVYADVVAVSERRHAGRLRQKKWRNEAENSAVSRVMKTKHNEADKIREDKIREDINKNMKPVKPASNPFVKILLNEFSELWKDRRGRGAPYHVVHGKDQKLMQALLRTYSPDQLRPMMVKFFDIKDDFYERRGYSLGMFYQAANQVVDSAQRGSR